MNRPFSSLLALCFALVLCFQLTPGQQTASNTSDKEAKATELREKAYGLLASLADQIGTLQSPENRARLGSNIAGSLWPHDEKRARALFKLVEEDIKLGLQVEKTAPHSQHTFQVFFKLRDNTAERMAQHDPELALEFVRDTVSFVNEYARLPNGEISPAIARQEHELESRLAKKLSTVNPEVAIKLARQSLANGLSKDLLPVLRRSSKDKAQALAFYKEIVSKLRDADFDDWQTFDFAITLAQSYTPPTTDDSAFRELIHIFITKSSDLGCTRQPLEDDHQASFCAQIGTLLPLMEKFYPVEARRLKEWKSEDEGYGFDRYREYSELNEIAEQGTIDEVLSLTSKYPDMEGSIRLRAMLMAESDGDTERAEKIAGSYSGDPEIRRSMDARIMYYKEVSANIAERWAETQKQAERLPLRIQVTLLTNLAHQMTSRDKKASLKVLANVSNLIDLLPPGGEQTVRQIELATVYCLAGSDQGFVIMEGLLPKLNELIAASAKLDNYDTRYLRDGEWNMTAEGAVGNILTVLANNAGAFAFFDFDRAVTLAAQFDRSEIRMMAQLKLAQGILGGRPKRIPNSNGMIIER